MMLQAFDVCSYRCNFDDIEYDDGARAGVTRACGDERIVFLAPKFVD